jgi:hypothetical protein
MKKKIISLILIGIVSLGLIGCVDKPTDVINKNTNTTSNNRFIDTEDVYGVDDFSYKIFYDSVTKIVYLSNNYNGGYSSTASLSPLYGQDKMPMTLDEYNKSK